MTPTQKLAAYCLKQAAASEELTAALARLRAAMRARDARLAGKALNTPKKPTTGLPGTTGRPPTGHGTAGFVLGD